MVSTITDLNSLFHTNLNPPEAIESVQIEHLPLAKRVSFKEFKD